MLGKLIILTYSNVIIVAIKTANIGSILVS